MILSDKIIMLRKKNGWSQEELADKMNVSRQAVSKWESSQSVPDLTKIVQLSELFGVTTDYLVKDENETEIYTNTNDTTIKRVSMEMANEFLMSRDIASKKIAIGTVLSMLSILPLIILFVMHEQHFINISENAVSAIGITILILTVAFAVFLFLSTGFANEPYEFLEKEPFENEYGLTQMVKERQKLYRPTYNKCNIIATIICIVGALPLIILSLTENEMLVIFGFCLTVITEAGGVFLFISCGVKWVAMQKLLKEGEYYGKIIRHPLAELITTVYWLAVTAIYLAWSFLTYSWYISWVIWPIAGILYSIISAILRYKLENEHQI